MVPSIGAHTGRQAKGRPVIHCNGIIDILDADNWDGRTKGLLDDQFRISRHMIQNGWGVQGALAVVPVE